MDKKELSVINTVESKYDFLKQTRFEVDVDQLNNLLATSRSEAAKDGRRNLMDITNCCHPYNEDMQVRFEMNTDEIAYAGSTSSSIGTSGGDHDNIDDDEINM